MSFATTVNYFLSTFFLKLLKLVADSVSSDGQFQSTILWLKRNFWMFSRTYLWCNL